MKHTALARSIRIAALAGIAMLAAHGVEASENEAAIAPPAAWRSVQFGETLQPTLEPRMKIDWTRTTPRLRPSPPPRVRPSMREAPAPHGRRSRARKVARMIFGAFAGSVVGFYGGALIGAAVSGDCNGCDDPYFPGVVIGALIGCPVGAVTGAMLSR